MIINSPSLHLLLQTASFNALQAVLIFPLMSAESFDCVNSRPNAVYLSVSFVTQTLLPVNHTLVWHVSQVNSRSFGLGVQTRIRLRISWSAPLGNFVKLISKSCKLFQNGVKGNIKTVEQCFWTSEPWYVWSGVPLEIFVLSNWSKMFLLLLEYWLCSSKQA